jgi:hypothetical protein
MKNIEPIDSNDRLSTILRESRVMSPLPPHFTEDVWQRIARPTVAVRPSLWGQMVHWIEQAFPGRAIALGYLAVLLMGGIAAGFWRGQDKAGHIQHELALRYLQSIDPYQATMAGK